MSFRNRLTIFFIVLVILPMVVVATVGFVLAAASEQGKTDASLSAARRSASGLFREFQDRAEVAARNIGQDAQLSAAIEAGKRGPIQTRLEALATENNAVRTLMRLEETGRFETGRGVAVAPARSRLIDAEGATVGVLTRLGHLRQGLRPARQARHGDRGRHRRARRDDLHDPARRAAPRSCPRAARSRSPAPRGGWWASTARASTAAA